MTDKHKARTDKLKSILNQAIDNANDAILVIQETAKEVFEEVKDAIDDIKESFNEETKETKSSDEDVIDYRDVNEIKKLLYKKNPIAKICYITKNGIVYVANHDVIAITFIVPLADIGDAKFSPEMDSKLMIRYLSTINAITDN